MVRKIWCFKGQAQNLVFQGIGSELLEHGIVNILVTFIPLVSYVSTHPNKKKMMLLFLFL